MSITLVVALDSPMASELTCRELKRHHRKFEVLACAHTSDELIQQVSEHQPNVAVLSPHLQEESSGGLHALRTLRTSGSRTRPVVVGDWSDPQTLVSVFVAGARGVVGTGESIAVLCKCIRAVHAGQIWANKGHVGWIVEALAMRDPIAVVGAKRNGVLTEREKQVVAMVAEGFPNSEISSNLGVSPHTVKNHLFRIYEKLGVSSRLELVLYSLNGRET